MQWPDPVAASKRASRRVAAVLLAGSALAMSPVALERADGPGELVVLLHGLGRSHRSMAPLEEALEERGYRVVNIGYPSLEHSVDELTDSLHAELVACCSAEAGPIHFVTHSLGGILVRSYVERYGLDRLGRVVMLSPPNRGSQLVDRLSELGLFELIMGPAAVELGTDETAAPRRLGPVEFELGIITGDASLNPLFSWWLPGSDDGKVTVESAWVDGAHAFLVVPYSHAFIMRRAEVIDHVITFLEAGHFRIGPPAAVAGEGRTDVFRCDSGLRFTVHAMGDAVRVFLPDREADLLPRSSRRDGRYQHGGLDLRMGTDAARLVVDGVVHDGCTSSPRDAIWEDARIRGVAFRAEGQEPGWTLEIVPGRWIRFVGDYGRTEMRMPVTMPRLERGALRYSTSSEGGTVTFDIRPAACTDTMSGETFPRTVSLLHEGRLYEGCGADPRERARPWAKPAADTGSP